MELSSQMVLFARAVDAGSFSGAARELKLSPSAVSKQIGILESHLGVRLLSRSRRGISLTNDGLVFYERCAEIRRNVAAALEIVDTLNDHPQGTLRVATTVAFGKAQLLPALRGFLDVCPDVEIALEFNDRPVDFSTANVDLAIQFAEQIEDDSLIGRKLATNRRVICASPFYVRRYGQPSHPSEILQHNILRLSTVKRWNDWVSKLTGTESPQKIRSNFEANSADAIYHAALSGIGIARLPTYLISEDLRSGRLINLFPDCEDTESSVYATYPWQKNMSPRVRTFIDYISNEFGKVPPWERIQEGQLRNIA